jgi:sugar phosphate isomerase/epimerase
MKTGVSTASLFIRRENEQALPILHGLGVELAEVFLTSFSEYDEEFGKKIAASNKGVEIWSAHVLNTQFEPQLFATHPRVLGDAYFWLEKSLAAMRAFGATRYTFHGTARVKRATRSGEQDNFPSIIKGFQRLVETAEQYGVTVCLENVEWSTYNRPGVFEKIAREIPSLSGVLDIKQARISEYSYETYLTEMGNRLSHVHISDIDENGKMCLPGKGVFNFSLLIDRLKDVGFDGALLIEVYKDDYKEESELKTSCEFVNELLYKKGCLR